MQGPKSKVQSPRPEVCSDSGSYSLKPTAYSLLFCLALPLLAFSGLTPAERRGKQIYLRGESSSGSEITALMGESGVEVPASVLPRGNCHGRDPDSRI